ncbi:enoyl-CoA hydratase [Virgibacillus dakarensis]|uniref:Enoyl-CoA hydratase n=1 Tax=Lentibacillus populi TaxID=1827502 RepID=A0A9W5X3P7_9BACI|nr:MULTISPECIES: MaoC/PaaZ C-terminal domain-containing protein [Bacillaceae]MBT2216558.1 MaoC family dehydratase N-terminal domain-containing protein [Virgibacillus dakarensis]MTW84280.1 enoyl-CoA hydratase [Virgibacillus dakarensis]GGB27658.1 enoyl-CoA hydratase [Lentibacillus populi]
MIDKKRRLGKRINELQIGDSYTAEHIVEDRDLLLYLGLTDDANPLYIQHDYATQTPYKRPIVPSVMLFGMVSSIISMHLPGPGSHIVQHEMAFPKPVYHHSEVKFTTEVIAIDYDNHHITLSVIGYDVDGDQVLNGKLLVCPAYKPKSITASSLENFF